MFVSSLTLLTPRYLTTNWNLFHSQDVQQEAGPALENLNMIFHDEIQVLMAFEIVWMTGFVWCFLLKYPPSIKSLFLRRCLLGNAGYVAVSAPVRAVDTTYEKKCIVNFIWYLLDGFYAFMDTIFSIKSEDAGTGLRYKTEYCKIRSGKCSCRTNNLTHLVLDALTMLLVLSFIDKKTGSRYFYFRMRRYVFGTCTLSYFITE